MQPCNRIYYFIVHWRLNMFRAAHRSSSGAPNVFAASGLHTHVVTGRSQVWVGTGQFWFRLDYGRSPHAYVNRRLQIHLELLMMSGVPLETCWSFNERWNNKFYYKVASCWLFLLSQLYIYIPKWVVGSKMQKVWVCVYNLICHRILVYLAMFLASRKFVTGAFRLLYFSLFFESVISCVSILCCSQVE
jgi:hypothetical protein